MKTVAHRARGEVRSGVNVGIECGWQCGCLFDSFYKACF